MERPRRSGRASGTGTPQQPRQQQGYTYTQTATPSTSRAQYPTGNGSPYPQGGSTPYRPGAGGSGAPYGPPVPTSTMQHAGGPGGPYQGSGGPPPALGAPAVFPIGRSSAPVPPQLPIGPGQARFTTFASRARLGVSTLMQPIAMDAEARGGGGGGGGGYGGIDYGTTERTRGGGMRRRAAAGMRYYGEEGSDFDDDGDDGDDSARASLTRGSPSKANTPLGVEEEELAPGALLGLPPPGNKVLAKRAHQAHPLVYADANLREQAEKRDFLVPIRIELETDTHRIRDVFAWNLHEHLVTPHDFARIYVRDLELPAEPFTGIIEHAIAEQVRLAQSAGMDLVEVGPAQGGPFASRGGKKRSRDARSWDWGIKRPRSVQETHGSASVAEIIEDTPINSQEKTNALALNGANGHAQGGSADTPAERWKAEGSLGAFEDDIRVIVDYDVQIYRHHLRDRLEWDLCSPLTPEAFAKQTCRDLCLTGEALPIIANAVREQLLSHSRSAVELGLVGKGAEFARWQQEIEDADRDIVENRQRRQRGLPPLAHKPLQVISEEAEEEGVASTLEALSTRRRARPSLAATAVAQAAAAAFAASSSAVASAAGDETPAGRGPASSAAPEDRPSGTATPASAAVGSMTPMGNSAGQTLMPPAVRPQALPHQATSASSQQPILRTAAQRRAIAEYFQQQLMEKGSRKLQGVWREFHESREFGPLLEMYTDDDLERLDAEATRASRRGRRDQQRSGRRRR